MQNIDKEEDKKVLKNQNEQKVLFVSIPYIGLVFTSQMTPFY
jgi:hypothetical protein